jgi:hypothetical protein
MSPGALTVERRPPNRTMTIRSERKTRTPRDVLVKQWLRDPVDELALSRMWQAIESRFARRRSRLAHLLTLVPAIVVAASVGTAT